MLDAIHRVQATQAGDLAVRWNCKAGKCGSCSAEVDGRPRLLCMTRLSTFERRADHRHPPPHLPGRARPGHRRVLQLRDGWAGAGVCPRPREADGTYRTAPAGHRPGAGVPRRIECFLCQNVCHVIRDHEENKPSFAGPRMFIRYAELEMHPLETGDCRELLRGQMGLGLCNITKRCTEVRPGAHQHHRQRHHPAQGAGRRRPLRPDHLAGRQDPAPPVASRRFARASPGRGRASAPRCGCRR